MKTSVILLPFLLQCALISSEFQYPTLNGELGEQKWLKDVNLHDDTVPNDTPEQKSSLNDERRRALVIGLGLNRQETRPVQRISSATDWGGWLLGVKDDQVEPVKEDRGLPPLIKSSRKSESQVRRRRSPRYSPYSSSVAGIELPKSDYHIDEIAEDTGAKLNTMESDNDATFEDKVFGDNWLMFMMPFSTRISTAPLDESTTNADGTETQSGERSTGWFDDSDTFGLKKHGNIKRYETSETKKKEIAYEKNGKSLSVWDTHLTSRSNTELSRIVDNYETSYGEKESGKYMEKYGRPRKGSPPHLNGDNNSKNVKNDEPSGIGNDYYHGREVNGGIKNGETLFGDIFIDNTPTNVDRDDKASTAKLPVKISETRNEAHENKRPSEDESLFNSDPFVLLANLAGDTGREEEHKDPMPDEFNAPHTYEEFQSGTLIEERMNDAARNGKKSVGNKSHSGKAIVALGTSDGQRLEKSRDEAEADSDALELYNWDDDIHVKSNFYDEDITNFASNYVSTDETAEENDREGIEEEYDKHSGAAESSAGTAASRVKHREQIETKSRPFEEENVEGETPSKKTQSRIAVDRNDAVHRIDHAAHSQEENNHEWMPSVEPKILMPDADLPQEDFAMKKLENPTFVINYSSSVASKGNIRSEEYSEKEAHNEQLKRAKNERDKLNEKKLKENEGNFIENVHSRNYKSMNSKETSDSANLKGWKLELEGRQKEKGEAGNVRKDKIESDKLAGAAFGTEYRKGGKFGMENMEMLESELGNLNPSMKDQHPTYRMKYEEREPEAGTLEKINSEMMNVEKRKSWSENRAIAERTEFELDGLGQRIGRKDSGNVEYKAESSNSKRLGLEGSRKEGHDFNAMNKNKLEWTDEENEKSRLLISKGTQNRKDVSSTNILRAENNLKSGRMDLYDTSINGKKNIVPLETDRSGGEESLSTKSIKEMNDHKKIKTSSDSAESFHKKHEKYHVDESVDSSDRSSKKIVKSLSSDATSKRDRQEDVRVTYYNAFAALDKSGKSVKEKDEKISHGESLNLDMRHGILGNNDKEDEKLISSERLMDGRSSTAETRKNNYNLRVDHLEASKAKDEKLREQEIKQLSTAKEINDAAEKNEEKYENQKILDNIGSEIKETADKAHGQSKELLDATETVENVRGVDKKYLENHYLKKITRYYTKKNQAGSKDKVLKENNENSQYNELRNRYTRGNELNKLLENKVEENNTLSNKQITKKNIITSGEDSFQNNISKDTVTQQNVNNKGTQQVKNIHEYETKMASDSGTISKNNKHITDTEATDTAKFRDKMKTSHASKYDTFETHSGTRKDDNSVPKEILNKTDQSETRGSYAELNKSIDADIRNSDTSNKVKQNNDYLLATGKPSKEDNRNDVTKLMEPKKLLNMAEQQKYEGIVQTRNDVLNSTNTNEVVDKAVSEAKIHGENIIESEKREQARSSAEKKEKSETQTVNEIYNAREALNTKVLRTIVTEVGSEEGKSKESSLGKRTSTSETVGYNSDEVYTPEQLLNAGEKSASNEVGLKDIEHAFSPRVNAVENMGAPDELFKAEDKIDKVTEHPIEMLGAIAKEHETAEQNVSINRTELLSKKNRYGLINQRESKIVANDVNSGRASDTSSTWSSKFSGNNDTTRASNKSSAVINHASEEELEQGKTTGSKVADKHLSKHSDIEMISNLSHESASRKEMNEMENTKISNDKTYGPGSKDEMLGSSRIVANVIDLLTRKRSEELIDKNKSSGFNKFVKENKEATDRDEIHSIEGIKIATSDNIKGPSSIGKEVRTSMKKKNGLRDDQIEEREQKAFLNGGESIRPLSNKEEGPRKGSNTITEVTVSNGVAKESEESLSTVPALKATKDETSNPESSTDTFQKNGEFWKEGDGAESTGSSETKIAKDGSVRNDAKKGSKNRMPPTARQLIENEKFNALPVEGVRTTLNSKTTNGAYPSGTDENPIMSRLAEESVARQTSWTDNERYKGLSSETGQAREKMQSKLDARNSKEAELSEHQFEGKSESTVKELEEIESGAENKNAEERERLHERRELEELMNSKGKNRISEEKMKEKLDNSKGAQLSEHKLDRKSESIVGLLEGIESRTEDTKNVEEKEKLDERKDLRELMSSKVESKISGNNYERRKGETVKNVETNVKKIGAGKLPKGSDNVSYLTQSSNASDRIANDSIHRSAEKLSSVLTGAGVSGHILLKDESHKNYSSSVGEDMGATSENTNDIEKDSKQRKLQATDNTHRKDENISLRKDKLINDSDKLHDASIVHSLEKNRKGKSEAFSNKDTLLYKKNYLVKEDGNIETELEVTHGQQVNKGMSERKIKQEMENLEKSRSYDVVEDKIWESENVLKAHDRNVKTQIWKPLSRNELDVTISPELKQSHEQNILRKAKNVKDNTAPAIVEQRASGVSDKYSEAEMNKTNLSESFRNSYSVNEKIADTEPSIKEDSNAEFAKKEQPSFEKFLKPSPESTHNREDSFPASSKSLKLYHAGKEVAKPVQSTSVSEVLGISAMNDDLCEILRSIFLFTRSGDDTNDGEVPSTYEVSSNTKAREDVGERRKGNVKTLVTDLIEKPTSMPQELHEDAFDVYIVKRTDKGPVKIVHVDSMEPLAITSEDVQRNTYEKITDILRRSRTENTLAIS